MKKTFTLLCFMFLAFITTRAQLTEVEPNDTFTTANFMPFDSAMTGVTCRYVQVDVFKFVTPFNGKLRLATAIQAAGGNDPKHTPISMILFSNTGKSFANLSPKIDTGSAKKDTLYFECIAADTFYLLVNGTSGDITCYSYEFSLSMVAPAFTPGATTNHTFNTAEALDENVSTHGQLGFKHQPGATFDNNYYKLVSGADGTLHIIASGDYNTSPGHSMNAALYDKNQVYIDSFKSSLGPIGNPVLDTVSFRCQKADTFYVRVYQGNIADCGWSYELKYQLQQPLYGGDAEPNNSFAQATNKPVGQNVSGHVGYTKEFTNDYYKIFKPDNGFLQLIADASTDDTTNGMAVVTLFDKNTVALDSTTVPVGSFTGFGEGLIFANALPMDSYYVEVRWPVGAPCGAYRMIVTTETVSAGIKEDGSIQVVVFPNPTASTFTFDLGGIQASALQVYDMQGRLVESVTGARLQSRMVTVGAALPSGVYTARVSGSGASGVVKLVKTGK